MDQEQHPMKGMALLVIDMQYDMFVLNPKNDRAVQNISDLIAWARTKEIPIIYSRVTFRPSYVDEQPFAPHIKERRLLLETSRGSEILDELKPTSDDIVVIKHRASVFYCTELEIMLRALGVHTVLFSGFSTSRAIESTVRDAHNRDIRCIVASDCCFARTAELHDNALKSIADWFGQVMTAKEIKKQFA
jgi:nicotinamidase-related amidase